MDENYHHCAALVRASDKDRFLATLFAPADKRGPLSALYAFKLEIAGVRDRAREPMPGEIRLQWWRDVLNGERGGESAANPVAAALLETVARFGLPIAALLDVIEAHSFDLYNEPMPTLAALEAYARKTESNVIAHAAHILTGKNDALRIAAEHTGIAIAFVQVLRSFARHASRRLLYVPIELLDRHAARVDNIYAGVATPPVLAALADLRNEARRHYSAFEALLPQFPRSAIPAFLPTVLVPNYLAAMERPGYDPFRTAVAIPQWRHQWRLWRAARRYSRKMRG
jgi:15-cis-phytoene synthase